MTDDPRVDASPAAPSIIVPFTAHRQADARDQHPSAYLTRVGQANGVAANGRPLSPSMRRPGRPFYADTPLARLMIERNLRAVDVTTGAGVNPRALSDYLSARRVISPRNVARLAVFFDVPEQRILDMNDEIRDALAARKAG